MGMKKTYKPQANKTALSFCEILAWLCDYVSPACVVLTVTRELMKMICHGLEFLYW